MEKPFENRFTATVLSLLAGMQMLLFCLTGGPTALLAGLIVGVLLVCNAIWGRQGRFHVLLLSVLSAAIVANSLFHVYGFGPAIPHRLLFVAVMLGYASVTIAAAVALLFRTAIAPALLPVLSCALCWWSAEALLQRGPLRSGERPQWIGGPVAHPVVGECYSPHSVVKTTYPDNPRHYFEESDPAKTKWRLVLHAANNAAELTTSSDAQSPMRVEIKRADTPILWHIQLLESWIPLQKRTAYQLTFSARADAQRKIAYGVIQAHAPWRSLGLYGEISIDTGWRRFDQRFSASSSDTDAELHFDLGSSASSVELANVTLRRLSDGVVIDPVAPVQYSVTYRFNDLGCRGPDYPIPRPADHRRIVAIGDSYTLGVGVHQADTFEERLARSLNGQRKAAGEPVTDVINCGVSGYATREERLFFELFASRYQPHIVLLMLVFNDERSWLDDVRLGYVHAPSALENILLSWRLVQTMRHEGRRPPPDFTPNVQEILRLNEDCRRQNARLAVFFFRNSELQHYAWQPMVTTISAGLANTDIPVIDLGNELLRAHSEVQLAVHPLDGHPNEVAHAMAAEQIESFLRHSGWLDDSRSSGNASRAPRAESSQIVQNILRP